MTQEQKRAAIRRAVENKVHKENPALDGGPEKAKVLTEGQKALEASPLQKDGDDSRIKTEGAAGAKERKIKRPKLSKVEWRQVQSARMKKYGTLGETEIPERGYVFAHDKFYVIHNYGPGDFEVIMRLNPVTQTKVINDILEGKLYGNDGEIGTIGWKTDGKY